MKAVLSIAGSDSSGGAGIQADIKTIAAHRLYAETVITALTAQNTLGVTGIQEATPDFVRLQLDAVFDDIRPDAVKVGMVSSPEIIRAIASGLREHRAANVVVDPVMVATSGSRLISEDAVSALVSELLPLADVVTPNIPEAEILAKRDITTEENMVEAAHTIARACGSAVLLKGGHRTAGEHAAAEGFGRSVAQDSARGGVEEGADSAASDAFSSSEHARDLLVTANGQERWFAAKRIMTKNTHGTGCTLSSAIACGLARGLDVVDAVGAAKTYITGAIAHDLRLGCGHGPLNHMWEYE